MVFLPPLRTLAAATTEWQRFRFIRRHRSQARARFMNFLGIPSPSMPPACSTWPRAFWNTTDPRRDRLMGPCPQIPLNLSTCYLLCCCS